MYLKWKEPFSLFFKCMCFRKLVWLLALTFLNSCDSSSTPTDNSEDKPTDYELDTETSSSENQKHCVDIDNFDQSQCPEQSIFDADDCVVYVDGDIEKIGDGLSWTKSFKQIQPAIDVAYCHAKILGSCQVWVKQGTYYIYENCVYDSLRLRPGVTLLGGFLGNEIELSARDHLEHKTILNGTASPEDKTAVHHVVSGSNDSSIDGFSILAGNAAKQAWSKRDQLGAGLINWESSTTVSNCIFSGNSASFWGGAIYSYKGTLSLYNTTFTDNSVPGGNGGAIYSVEGDLSVNNCLFERNTAYGGGGAIAIDRGSLIVTESVFNNNHSNQMGGAIFLLESTFQISDCLFHGNTSIYVGGGVLVGTSDGMIEECEFLDNSSSMYGGAITLGLGGSVNIANGIFHGNKAHSLGGAIFIRDNVETTIVNSSFSSNKSNGTGGAIGLAFVEKDYVKLYNSILWGNLPDEIKVFTQGEIYVAYSNVQGGFKGDSNISSDPLFVNPGNRDLSLLENSPCIDAAHGDYASKTDLEGNERVDIPNTENTGTGTPNYADMGALEFHY